MKAIKITKENVDSLASQYLIDKEDAANFLPLDHILVSDFGQEWYDGVMTQEQLDAQFVTTGETLKNGYFIVEPI